MKNPSRRSYGAGSEARAVIVLTQELLAILLPQSDLVVTVAALEARVRLLMQRPPRGTTRKAIVAAAGPLFEMLQP
jgi:hypothetical protein